MSEKTEEKFDRTFTKKKKTAPSRYFDNPVEEDEVRKIKLKSEGKQNFDGEIIKVDQSRQKPLKYSIKYKKLPGIKRDKKPKIPTELLEKHTRGEKVEGEGVKTKFFKAKHKRKEVYLEYATEQAARTELLHQADQGFIQPGEDEITADYRQHEIANSVDIQSAAKHFNLKLDFGPYRMRYTKNGRHLLLGSERGHISSFDWVTKKLHCEFNAMEEVADVSWLHVPTMFACAQKNWVYIYDNQGTELHCIKRMYRVNRMEFLPYHFLLATANSTGYATWLDVSVGELVGNISTRLGDIRLMRNNPGNGVLCIGGGRGVVSMWSPKVREPLAKMLCHSNVMTALTVDPKGIHMVTAGIDRKVKVWDVRKLSGPLKEYHFRLPVNQVEVSQRGALAISQGNLCQIFSNLSMSQRNARPYLQHNCDGLISCMRFCPYEDILGVATSAGFQSLLVPGAGEPNFDALEDNPFQTGAQRREHEVHSLLEKVPPELITLDPNEIIGVDVPTLQEKIDAKREIFFVKPPQIEMKSRRKMKGRGGSVKTARNKQIVKDLKRKDFIADVRKAKQEVINDHKVDTNDFIPLAPSDGPSTALDRFKPKKRKA